MTCIETGCIYIYGLRRYVLCREKHVSFSPYIEQFTHNLRSHVCAWNNHQNYIFKISPQATNYHELLSQNIEFNNISANCMVIKSAPSFDQSYVVLGIRKMIVRYKKGEGIPKELHLMIPVWLILKWFVIMTFRRKPISSHKSVISRCLFDSFLSPAVLLWSSPVLFRSFFGTVYGEESISRVVHISPIWRYCICFFLLLYGRKLYEH